LFFGFSLFLKAEHIERIERKITEVLKRDGSRKVNHYFNYSYYRVIKDEENRLLEQIRQNEARISSEQDKV
jgi:hypothetical protein